MYPSPLIRPVVTRRSDPVRHVAREGETRERDGMASAGGGVRGGSRLVRERQAWVFFVCVFVFHQIGLRARVCEGRLSDHWTRWCVLVWRLSCALYGCRAHRACPFDANSMFFRQTRSVGRSSRSSRSSRSVAREEWRRVDRVRRSLDGRSSVSVDSRTASCTASCIDRFIIHSFVDSDCVRIRMRCRRRRR